MTKMTKERIEQYIANPLENGLTRGEQMEMARMLLAGMEQEPVAHLSAADVNNVEEHILARRLPSKACTMPVYAAPQPALAIDADDNFYSWFGREWHEHYQQNQYTTAAKQMLGVMAESAWKAGRRAAMLQAGNSPVTPDSWIKCSERMPEGTEVVLIITGYMQVAWWDDDAWVWGDDSWSKEDVTHWMPLPAAPQQEQASTASNIDKR